MNKKQRKKKAKRERLNSQDRPAANATLPAAQRPTWRVRFRRFIRRSGSALALLITIVSVPSAVLIFFPRFSVSPGQSLDNSNPFATPFLIGNDGYLPLYEVKMLRLGDELEFEVSDVNKLKLPPPGTALDSTTVYYTPRLDPSEHAAVMCKHPVPNAGMGKLSAAAIRIRLSYRVYPFSYRKQTSFRFVAEHAADGSIQWFPRPVPKPDPIPEIKIPNFP